MSIEIKIPKEITEYKEKIIFGLSIRQLISLFIGMSISIGVYISLYKKIGHDLTGYIVIIICIPIFGIGFIKINNFTFEEYIKNIIRHYLGDRVVSYKTLKIDTQPKKKNKKIRIKKSNRKNEYNNTRKMKFNDKAKRKKIMKAIKKSKKEYKKQSKKLSKKERGIVNQCFLKLKKKIKRVIKKETKPLKEKETN
jgi:hypothetical protein